MTWVLWRPVTNQTDSLEASAVRLCETSQLWGWCALRMGVALMDAQFWISTFPLQSNGKRSSSANNMHVWHEQIGFSCSYTFISLCGDLIRFLILPGFFPDPQLRISMLCGQKSKPISFLRLFSGFLPLTCFQSFLPGCRMLILYHCYIGKLSFWTGWACVSAVAWVT